MKIAFSATLISQIIWGTLFPFHIRAATVCPGITNEDSCISTSDTREDYKSPCVWCCGNECEPGIGIQNWACEPLLYLEDSSQNWDGNGRTQYGDACGVNNESLRPPTPTFTSDYFFGGPRQIARATVGRPEAIFISPPTDYSLSFNIEPKSKIGDYGSIIHFTTGNDCCGYGNRVPGIFFAPNTTQLHIITGTDVDGNDYSDLPNGLTLHMKHAIEVRVFGSKSSVYVNGELVLEKTIGTRAPLAQVDMYIGNPWYDVADAIISDVSFPYKPTAGPTTVFEYQNFTIGILQSSFVNDPIDGFTISLNYEPLGHSIKNLSLSLHYSNCTTPISDQVVALKDNTLLSGERTLLIDTGKFSSSDHVVNSDLDKNESVGVLGFCVRAEGFDSVTGGTSVSFRQDEIYISYDLSSNSFNVIDNTIIADEIETSENNITSTYEVEAFRCTDDFTRDDIVKPLAQNDIVYICVRPVNLTVHISDFEMYFWQDDENKYEAVSYGENVNPLSQLLTKDKTKRVASRIISRFFNGDANDFVVKGNSYLSFDTSRERQLRSIQEPDQTAEARYTMKVELEKEVFQKNAEESDIYEVVGFAAAGTFVFSIIILTYKKTKLQFSTRN